MSKSCSETIKAIGLKSTKQVANLNGVSPRTVQLAFKENPSKFYHFIWSAIDSLHNNMKLDAINVLSSSEEPEA